jgi:hypothetical protein
MELNEHEKGFVNSFVVPERRARVIELLSSPKSRQKQLRRLDHSPNLDPRSSARLPAGQQDEADIEALLRKHGAPDQAYVLSSYPGFDARELPLKEALANIVGSGHGSVISCVPGQLAYYEGESPRERFLLKKDAGRPRLAADR